MGKKIKFKKKLAQLLKPFKWFYPGMGVKRWYLFSFIGIIIIVTGGLFLSDPAKVNRISGIVFMFLGIAMLAVGVNRVILTLVAVISPKDELVDLVYQKKHLGRGVRIVTIGGGTGLSSLLQGLKQYTSNLAAIVTVADEGGSSGKLRKEFGVLPPGDIRNCLVALADTGPLMEELFQYRFEGSSALTGHSFGNIFLLALSQVTDGFEEAVQAASKILAIRGQVIPSTLGKVRLLAELQDGSTALGEANITERKNLSPIKKITLQPSSTKAADSAIEAINNADAIIFGPGSLYTSIIPNLLIDDIAENVNRSTATKICVCNVMTQSGETDRYDVADHIKAIYDNTKLNNIDYCLINSSEIPAHLAERYAKERAFQVKSDIDAIKKNNVTPIEDNLISINKINGIEYIRHNPRRLAKTIIDIISIAKTEVAHR